MTDIEKRLREATQAFREVVREAFLSGELPIKNITIDYHGYTDGEYAPENSKAKFNFFTKKGCFRFTTISVLDGLFTNEEIDEINEKLKSKLADNEELQKQLAYYEKQAQEIKAKMGINE